MVNRACNIWKWDKDRGRESYISILPCIFEKSTLKVFDYSTVLTSHNSDFAMIILDLKVNPEVGNQLKCVGLFLFIY